MRDETSTDLGVIENALAVERADGDGLAALAEAHGRDEAAHRRIQIVDVVPQSDLLLGHIPQPKLAVDARAQEVAFVLRVEAHRRDDRRVMKHAQTLGLVDVPQSACFVRRRRQHKQILDRAIRKS